MANNAVKILYSLFERIEGVSCERVFAVPSDFEQELRTRDIPLYSLESGTPISQFDIVAFSIGYELAATTILSVLDLGNIPIRSDSRDHNDPIVIGGGPAVTNPTPFGAFIDAVFIGEMEGCVPALIQELVELKKRGAGRMDLLERITDHESFWSRNATGVVRAARYMNFGDSPLHTALPIPGLRTIQDHGVVEIMRGCPNGCRFCHAGVFYRPFREKPFDVILDEVEYLVSTCGYREVTISSLSTGDYSDVFPLVRRLNSVYSAQRVSFSLPSIRIDSFTLSLLEQVSAVRKSGLTFAVETPREDWQRGINKEVSLEKSVEIMLMAKEHGWKIAKFYFMLGLPVTGGEDETPAIAQFLETVSKRTGMGINVNVATFVPKPHTPFQWAAQLDEAESNHRIQWLKQSMRKKPIAVRYNSPFASVIEGVICRGDARVGDLIENAYRNGARLDAWEEYFDRSAWRKALDDADWSPEETSLKQRDPGAALPWSGISLGVHEKALAREYKKAQDGELTEACSEHCAAAHCGVCRPGTKVRVVEPSDELQPLEETIPTIVTGVAQPPAIVADISYTKKGRAVYLSHLDTLRVFERAFYRSGIIIRFTQGFNPKPRIEFAHPLTLGYSSSDEIVRILLAGMPDEETFIETLNPQFHDGYVIKRVKLYEKTDSKLPSLMSRYWGSEYSLSCGEALEGSAGPEGTPEGTSVDAFSDTSMSGEKIWTLFCDEAARRDISERVTLLAVRPHGIDIRLQSSGKQTNLRNILTDIEDRDSEAALLRVVRLRLLSVSSGESGFADYF